MRLNEINVNFEHKRKKNRYFESNQFFHFWPALQTQCNKTFNLICMRCSEIKFTSLFL